MNRFNVFNAYNRSPYFSGGYRPNMSIKDKMVNIDKLQKEIEDYETEEKSKNTSGLTLKKLMKEGILLSGVEILVLFIIILVMIYKYIELTCKNNTLLLFYELNKGLFKGLMPVSS